MAWVRAANQHRAIAEEIILKELTTGCLVAYQYKPYASFKNIAKQKQEVIKWVMEYLSDYSLDYDIVKRTEESE